MQFVYFKWIWFEITSYKRNLEDNWGKLNTHD